MRPHLCGLHQPMHRNDALGHAAFRACFAIINIAIDALYISVFAILSVFAETPGCSSPPPCTPLPHGSTVNWRPGRPMAACHERDASRERMEVYADSLCIGRHARLGKVHRWQDR